MQVWFIKGKKDQTEMVEPYFMDVWSYLWLLSIIFKICDKVKKKLIRKQKLSYSETAVSKPMHGNRHPSHRAHMNLGQADLLDNDEDMLH